MNILLHDLYFLYLFFPFSLGGRNRQIVKKNHRASSGVLPDRRLAFHQMGVWCFARSGTMPHLVICQVGDLVFHQIHATTHGRGPGAS